MLNRDANGALTSVSRTIFMIFSQAVAAVQLLEIQFKNNYKCQGAPSAMVSFSDQTPSEKTNSSIPDIYTSLKPIHPYSKYGACGNLPLGASFAPCCYSFRHDQSPNNENYPVDSVYYISINSANPLQSQYPTGANGQKYCRMDILDPANSNFQAGVESIYVSEGDNCLTWNETSIRCENNGHLKIYPKSKTCSNTPEIFKAGQSISNHFNSSFGQIGVSIPSVYAGESNPGWIAVIPAQMFVPGNSPFEIFSFACILIALFSSFLALIFSIYLCVSRKQTLNFLFASTMLLLFLSISLRVFWTYKPRSTMVEANSIMFYSAATYQPIHALATLSMAFYSAVFLAFIKRFNSRQILLLLTSVLILNLGLAGTRYYESMYYFIFHQTEPIISKTFSAGLWNLWVYFYISFDFIPLFCVFNGILLEKSWKKRVEILRNADRYIFLVIGIDLLAVLSLILEGILSTYTALLGSDSNTCALLQTSLTLQTTHVLCTIYLNFSVSKVLNYQMERLNAQ